MEKKAIAARMMGRKSSNRKSASNKATFLARMAAGRAKKSGMMTGNMPNLLGGAMQMGTR